MRSLGGRDVYHFHYARYVSDPLAEIDALYDWLNVELTPTARTSMQSWLAADPLEVSRRTRSSLSDYGIDDAALARRFASYVDTFGVDTSSPRNTQRWRTS